MAVQKLHFIIDISYFKLIDFIKFELRQKNIITIDLINTSHPFLKN